LSKPAANTKHSYRMKELCELTGLTRQAIHYYVQQGLLPPGKKTGRNMAYYNDAHVERLRLIQKLQHERFLPLKAIKAILDDETGGFEPDQRQLLREVKDRLAGSPLSKPELTHTLDAATVCERHGVDPDELQRMAELHLLSVVDDGSGPRISADDEWLVEQWGNVRRLGFTNELGFGVDDLAIYEQAVSGVFDYEKSRMLERMTHLPPDRVAEMVEQIMPLIHQFMVRFHTAHIRNFFAAME
jgi:DNA-binding transcriptional MerR regulator